MSESEPGRVSAERDPGAVPVGDGALVVAEQGRREKVDQERDIAGRSGCESRQTWKTTNWVSNHCCCPDWT